MRRQLILLYALLFIALVAIGWLGYQFYQAEFKASTYLAEKQELNSEFDELSRELLDAEEGFELLGEEFSVQKEEFIARKQEIQELQQQVKELTSKNRLTQNQLNEARQLIAEIRKKNNQIVVSQLEAKNQYLGYQMTSLQEKYQDSLESQRSTLRHLRIDLQKKIEENKNLSQVADIKEDEKEQLTQTIEENKKKINYATLVPITSLNIVGKRKKRSGEVSETKNDKKVDLLEINFSMKKNQFSDIGNKEFLIRIIEPTGTVLYKEASGSGTFTSVNDEKMKYTKKHTANYNQTEQDISVNWSQNQPFKEGVYTVQIFQNGYLVGENTLVLK